MVRGAVNGHADVAEQMLFVLFFSLPFSFFKFATVVIDK